MRHEYDGKVYEEVKELTLGSCKGCVFAQDCSTSPLWTSGCSVRGVVFKLVEEKPAKKRAANGRFVSSKQQAEAPKVGPKPDAAGWIEWNGGDCPVAPGTIVECRLRDADSAPSWHETAKDASDFSWSHEKATAGLDIIAYRLVNDEPTPEATTPLDTQVGGSHYKDLKIQPVEYIHANGIGYFEGNVIKYVSRWKAKNGIADLEKAKHYIDLLIQLESAK